MCRYRNPSGNIDVNLEKQIVEVPDIEALT
jgi:hypothetical protein